MPDETEQKPEEKQEETPVAVSVEVRRFQIRYKDGGGEQVTANSVEEARANSEKQWGVSGDGQPEREIVELVELK